MLAKNSKEWHKIVCKRDGYICQRCGEDYSYPYYFDDKGRNQYVCGHHTKTKGAYPELKLETDIGECICDLEGCHTKEHS